MRTAIVLGSALVFSVVASRESALLAHVGAARHDVLRLGASGTIDGDGGHLAVGPSSVAIGLAAFGRAGAVRPVRAAEARSVGSEVHLTRAPGVVEWWRSVGEGLEQGVTIAERPDGDGDLELRMWHSAGLVAETESDDAVLLRRGPAGPAIARYAQLSVVDAEGRRLPAGMRAEGGEIVIDVDDAGARYPVVVDPLLVATPEGTLMADGIAPDNVLSVALSRDGVRAAVGTDDGNGYVRIYTRTGSTWALEASLGGFGLPGELGSSVSLDGTGTRIAIGAPGDDSFMLNRGSVRVYVRSGTGTWTEEGILRSTADFDRSVGLAVAISADGNYVVAGNGERSSNGTVLMFRRTGTTWANAARFSDMDSDTMLGSAVAIDATGARVVAGASRTYGPAGQQGRVVVYSRASGTWAVEATLLAAGAADGDELGASVAMSGDGLRILAGAPGDDVAGASNQGSVRSFVRGATSWTEEATLTASGGAAGDGFGRSVALTGDATRAYAGAPLDDVAAVSNAGSARVFIRAGTTWAEGVTVTEAAPAATRSAGGSTAIADDGLRVATTVYGGNLALVHTLAAATGNGTACTADAGCLSGFCVDGVCCDTACGGGDANDCQSCVMARTGVPSGTCAPRLSTEVCRMTTGMPCDPHDYCDGSSTACPAAGLLPGGTVCRPSGGPCDIAEVCSGTSIDCPGDGFLPGGTTCGTAMGDCATPGTCSGTSAACGSPGFRPAGTVCRTAVGPCDVDDTCTGSSTVCTDRFAPSSTLCGSVPSGDCDAPDHCAGDSNSCVPTFAPSSRVCRAAAGTCDVPESCTGFATDCPVDTIRGIGFACRPAAGPCDTAEACDGASGACPADTFASSSTVCRFAAGPCDLEESCDGASAGCPANVIAPPGAVCRPPQSVCDAAETCSGLSTLCPTDAFAPAGGTCRAAAGACDAPEVCTGAMPTCPDDTVLAADTICRMTTGGCDPSEVCDGTSAACPGNALSPAGTECGGTVEGSCSSAGVCTGTDPSCPDATPLPEGTVCGIADPASECDVDDVCDGVSDACIPRFAPATQACGSAATGVCDAPDHCSGTSSDCQAVYLSGVECRASSGACDPAELCLGSAADCPPDGVHPAGTICRESSDLACDPLESCDGVGASCPADIDRCTAPDAGADAGTSDDAGAGDGGTEPTPAAGCACAVGATAGGRSASLLVLAIGLLIAARRRRTDAG